jgi:hypothetical protein
VVALSIEGLSSKVIAERLVLSVRTVDTHLQRAYVKLGVSDRHDLGAAIRLIRSNRSRPSLRIRRRGRTKSLPEPREIGMKKITRILVAVLAAGLAMVVASGVLATTKEEAFDLCMEFSPAKPTLFKECCEAVGGTWSFHSVEGETCALGGEYADDVSPDSEPNSSDPRVGTTSGTYEEPASAPAPARTGITSGTYQEPQPTVSGGSTTGTTSGTSAR